MSDYIKREDAVKIIERLATQITPPINIRLADVRCGVLSAKWLVEDMQSADVVEVVRCKDCKYYTLKPQQTSRVTSVRRCNRSAIVCTKPDDYCSFGERGTHEKDN